MLRSSVSGALSLCQSSRTLAAMLDGRVRRRRQEATGQMRTGNGFRLGAAIAGNRREIAGPSTRDAGQLAGIGTPKLPCGSWLTLHHVNGASVVAPLKAIGG